MKKLLLTIAICFIFTMGVAANSGSAVIPGYNLEIQNWNMQGFVIYTSNITPEPIDVEIILYKLDGTILNNVASYVDVVNTINFDGSAPENTFQYTLDGKNTGIFSFSNWILGQPVAGYGIIKWTQNSNAVQGLVARAHTYINVDKKYGLNTIIINGGQPF